MTAPFFDVAARLKGKHVIDADDTLAMRRVAWPDGKIDPAEAEAIFDLNGTVRNASHEWVDFFVEALTGYIVHQQTPTGYVDHTKADWVMAKIDSDGRVATLGELELFVKVLETATNVPDGLKTYALRQIESVIETGIGPTRDGGTVEPGSITASEVKLLRRVLFAQASDGPATVSRAEAEMLFRLKDATLGATNAPEWKTLFVQAIGNHLMTQIHYQPLDRARAADLEDLMNNTRVDVFTFLRHMAGTPLKKGFEAARTGDTKADMDAFADDNVDASEVDWVNAKIDADGTLDPFEEALVAFVAQERGTTLR